MNLIDRILNTSRFRESVKQNLTDDEIRMEFVNRHQARTGTPKTISSKITGNALLFTPKTIKDWNNAIASATDSDEPSLQLLSELYDNLLLDAHTRSVIETRVMRVTRSKFKVVNTASGEENEKLTEALKRPWFMQFLRLAVWSQFTGVKVLELYETDNEGQLTRVKDMPMAHLIPHKGQIAKDAGDTNGIPYKEGAYSRYYLQLGYDDQIGDLYQIAPLILAKKVSMGSWVNYIEKYGIDPRVAYTNNYTIDRENKLMQMLLNLKSADVAVLQDGEKIEALSSTDKDAYQIFKEMLSTLNDEISKAVLGQAGTVDAKEKTGTYGSMQVMQEVSEDRHESDRLLVRDTVNKDLFPKLPLISSFYSGFSNHQLEWDDTEEMTVDKVANLAVNLTNAGFEIDIDDLNERIPLQVNGYRDKLPGVMPGKNKPDALTAQIAAYYAAQGIGQDDDYTPQAVSLKVFQSTILAIARKLYNGDMKVDELDDDLINNIYKELEGATVNGLGDDYDEDDDEVPQERKTTAQAVKNNVYRFAAAKSYAENVAISNALLDDEGKLRSWSDFKKEVEKINQTFNRNYLQAEYQTARRSGQAIREWESFQDNADLFPNLEYKTVGDARVRDDHADINGIIKDLNDPFWDSWYPPNGFRCRCSVRQTDKPVTTGNVKITPDKGFKQHVGKTLEIYSDEHPAFLALPKSVAKDIDKRLKKRNEE